MSEKVKLFKKIIIHPKSIILIFIVTAVIVILSALIELDQSRKEMLGLMEKQSRSLLETLLASSSNALLSNEKIEDELRGRLLNNARLIKLLYEKNQINNPLLQRISKENNIFRINIFNNKGQKLFSSGDDTHIGPADNDGPLNHLKQIFEGEEDTLIIGVKQSRYLDGMRYAVALSTKGRGAILLNVDADELLRFRKQVGFGVLLKDVSKSSNIVYAVLQDDKNIIAASGKTEFVKFLDSTKISFGSNSINSNVILENNGINVYEARQIFTYKNEAVGVFRLGLSMEPVENINSRITRRIIIMSVLLFLFGSIALAFIFIRQNFLLLSEKFKSFKEYSQNIIDNIGESIILLDSGQIIKSANEATKNILGVEIENIINKPFPSVFDNTICSGFLENSSVVEVNCILNGIQKTLLISKSCFTDENKEENTILVIKDLTSIKELEKQFERQERLAAMGELASTVAHEIRNPLNAISTIVQQLNKDFEPKENKEEYAVFTKLVHSEVNRINTTIENFLRFARPVEIKKEEFPVSGLLEQLRNQYSSLALKRKIRFSTQLEWDGTVVWDRNQMLQAFINIIENSFDATSSGGEISIALSEKPPAQISITIKDTGVGIDDASIEKVFNLYYTTKQKGNGIGLSIVQKIIDAHNGQIQLESVAGKGTSFIITLPKTN